MKRRVSSVSFRKQCPVNRLFHQDDTGHAFRLWLVIPLRLPLKRVGG